MDQALTEKIAQLGADYATVASDPFDFFFCPILFRDDNVELCKAHVVNQAFRNTPPIWTVQRKDVDNFYGGHFEAEFTTLQDLRDSPEIDVFSRVFVDKTLYKKLEPKILLGGESVDYFIRRGNTPKIFTPIEIEQDERTFPLGLKMPPEAVEASTADDWDLEISKDVRMPALVSLIKAAHLTLFHMLGYSYALSAIGEFAGRQILGNFFQQNRDKERPEVLENAHSFFTEFVHIVRPVLDTGLNLQGTVNDRFLMVCRKENGFWAQIVFVKTGRLLHAVMLPVWDRLDMIAVYLDFLKNENEIITVSLCQFDHDHWNIDKRQVSMIWPKSDVTYQTTN